MVDLGEKKEEMNIVELILQALTSVSGAVAKYAPTDKMKEVKQEQQAPIEAQKVENKVIQLTTKEIKAHARQMRALRWQMSRPMFKQYDEVDVREYLLGNINTAELLKRRKQ